MSAATPSSRHWQDLSAAEFAALDRQRAIAVLPVAAVEQHGPHLPVSVDSDIAHGVIEAALAHLPPDLPALFLPVQSVGFSPEHTGFAGTLSLRADTVMRLWTELAECVADAGVKKLLLFNTHGGQVGLLDPVARDLRARRGLLVVSTSWFQLPLLDAHGNDVNARFSAHERRFGAHAGEVETALMRVLKPQRVRMALAQDFRSSSEQRAERFAILGNGRSAKMGWAIEDYNPSGAVGDSASASAEKGERVVQAAAASLAALLSELHELDSPVAR